MESQTLEEILRRSGIRLSANARNISNLFSTVFIEKRKPFVLCMIVDMGFREHQTKQRFVESRQGKN